MAVEAGLSLAAAIVKATTNGPPGLLRQELERVNRDIRAGAGRIEALEAMSSRLEIREVTQVVSALAQAEKTGSSVGETLRIQAEQQRVERFQRAEKKAMEAPVKLIFPLVAFIFPATFIVLGFPIVMRLVHGI
ncbi:type II secretion system F family protein [Halomonas sp. CH40]